MYLFVLKSTPNRTEHQTHYRNSTVRRIDVQKKSTIAYTKMVDDKQPKKQQKLAAIICFELSSQCIWFYMSQATTLRFMFVVFFCSSLLSCIHGSMLLCFSFSSFSFVWMYFLLSHWHETYTNEWMNSRKKNNDNSYNLFIICWPLYTYFGFFFSLSFTHSFTHSVCFVDALSRSLARCHCVWFFAISIFYVVKRQQIETNEILCTLKKSFNVIRLSHIENFCVVKFILISSFDYFPLHRRCSFDARLWFSCNFVLQCAMCF